MEWCFEDPVAQDCHPGPHQTVFLLEGGKWRPFGFQPLQSFNSISTPKQATRDKHQFNDATWWYWIFPWYFFPFYKNKFSFFHAMMKLNRNDVCCLLRSINREANRNKKRVRNRVKKLHGKLLSVRRDVRWYGKRAIKWRGNQGRPFERRQSSSRRIHDRYT